MEELAYQFLLQSGYPRASLVTDLSILPKLPQIEGHGSAPSIVVVDPNSAECLAVIKVIAADDPDGFDQNALTTGKFANQIGGDAIQAFVIRVDFTASDESQQVQFFRVWPGDQRLQLTAKTFPDLETLKISHRLSSSSVQTSDIGGARPSTRAHGRAAVSRQIGQSSNGLLIGLYLPAALLGFVLLVDCIVDFITGSGFISSAQSGLAVGIALLLTIPAAIRYYSVVSNPPN